MNRILEVFCNHNYDFMLYIILDQLSAEDFVNLQAAFMNLPIQIFCRQPIVWLREMKKFQSCPKLIRFWEQAFSIFHLSEYNTDFMGLITNIKLTRLETPLHTLAGYEGKYPEKILQYFLNSSPHQDTLDQFNHLPFCWGTPVHIALKRNMIPSAILLTTFLNKEKGRQTDVHGRSVIHSAIHYHRTEYLKYVLESQPRSVMKEGVGFCGVCEVLFNCDKTVLSGDPNAINWTMLDSIDHLYDTRL